MADLISKAVKYKEHINNRSLTPLESVMRSKSVPANVVIVVYLSPLRADTMQRANQYRRRPDNRLIPRRGDPRPDHVLHALNRDAGRHDD
jgi:hypothetical protein